MILDINSSEKIESIVTYISTYMLAEVGNDLRNDLPDIRDQAKKYADVPLTLDNYITQLIPDGKSSEFYYGGYTALLKIFAMADVAGNDLRDSIKVILWYYAKKIIDSLEYSQPIMHDESGW